MSQLLLSAALVVFWSSGFVGARLGTAYAPADTLLAWRYLVAAALLVVVLTASGARPGLSSWRRQGLVGLLCQVGYLGGVVSGIGLGVPAGTAALVAALQPLVVAGLAAAVGDESVSPRQLLALGAGLVGVALVISGDLGVGDTAIWVYALPVGGMLALSVGTVVGSRWAGGTGLLESLTVQTVIAAVAFVATALGRSAFVPPSSVGFWWSVAWVVGLSSFGGYGAYLLVLRQRGPTRVSALLYLTPPATMIWAHLMFGDAVGALGLVGLAVCAASVVTVVKEPRTRDRCEDAAAPMSAPTPAG